MAQAVRFEYRGTTTLSPASVEQRVCPDPSDPQKRFQILECAARAFITFGYEGANLERIANSAGIGKMTIYRHFLNKSDLFENVILEAVQTMSQSLGEILKSREPIKAVLTRFAERYIERMLWPVCGSYPFFKLAQTLVGACDRHPEMTRNCVAILEGYLQEPLRSYLNEKAATGEICPDEDCDFLADHFIFMLFPTNANALRQTKLPVQLDISALARRKVEMFFHGCGLRAS